MKREEKGIIVSSLLEKLNQYTHYYLTDISGLNAENTVKLRKYCFEQNVVLTVVKNTLFRSALEKTDFNEQEIVDCLKGQSAILFSNVGNAPAKLISQFRKEQKSDKPLLKAAWVEQSVYIGDENLKALESVKSRDELIGDIIGLLQSPTKNVIAALQSSGQILSGVVKTLSERGQ